MRTTVNSVAAVTRQDKNIEHKSKHLKKSNG